MRANIESKVIENTLILHDIDITFDKGISLIVGDSGSGKTSLIRELVPKINKEGTIVGEVTYKNVPIKDVGVGKIGFISQNPDNQIVCDKVWHELAFGLESLGEKTSVIRSRVAEISTYLNITSWFNKDVTALSGGEKQKLVLASILCMYPEVIIMDEPTSMLDPIVTREFWELVIRLAKDFKIDFIIAEHNINYICDFAKNIYVLDGGTLRENEEIPDYLLSRRKILESKNIKEILANSQPKRGTVANYTNLYYIREGYKDFTLNINKLSIKEGINCWIGPNGAGKTTLAKYLTGFFGKKKLKNSVMLPQDVLTIFSKQTVREELEVEGEDEKILSSCKEYLDSNPLDLSGGEQHFVALCKFLMKDVAILILDEPTKGMDVKMLNRVKQLLSSGAKNKVIVIISHDLDFVGDVANYVVMFFNGEIASEGEPHDVFSGNMFYKPEISQHSSLVSFEELNMEGNQ